MDERYVSVTEDEMLRRLRLLLKRKGRLTFNIIDDTAGVPSASSYVSHFGSLRQAFGRIGYKSTRDCDWIDSRQHWLGVLESHATQVAKIVRGSKVQVDKRGACTRVKLNGKSRICFLVARQLKKTRT
jgi:hypothetical protein